MGCECRSKLEEAEDEGGSIHSGQEIVKVTSGDEASAIGAFIVARTASGG